MKKKEKANGSSKQRSSESEIEPEANLAGLRELREAVENFAKRRIPRPARLRQEAIAGLTVGISSVPYGMAGGVLAGVNPIYGLYANVVGPIAGGLLSSTRLMVINNTSALALVAGQALVAVSPDGRDAALFAIVVLAGLIAILFGVLGMGRLTRFVSFSVMTGFLAGIAGLLILSQLPSVVGYQAEGPNRIAQTLNLLRQLEQLNIAALSLAILTIVLAVVLQRTRVRAFGSLIAIAVPSALAVILPLGVEVVGDIPRGIPLPSLPALADLFHVGTGALSLAIVVLVQGAGVSQSVPNPDGSRRSASRDFIAQGVANVASGLFRGLPVGGSLSGTALNVTAGATRRWAGIFSGLWLAVLLVVFPGLITYVAMPVLAGLLILVGFRSVNPSDLETVWSAGWPARLACATTFVATLFLPIQAAVGLGVVLSALLYVNSSSTDINLVEIVKRESGRCEERKAPKSLSSHSITVLDVYGNLFYAGARTLERLLPKPQKDASHPVVVLRMRGRTKMSATLIDVLSQYAERLAETGGRLYLTGLSQMAYQEAVEVRKLPLSGPVRAYEVTPVIGESTTDAYEDAEAWLVAKREQSP